jgi:hypothetical protein
MATKKQIAANRRNARKSTGPKTPAGKARSAQNATKHGLLSRWPVLPEEDGAAFERLRENLYCELLPLSQLERLLVTRLAAVQWRLARVPQLEAELFERLRRDAVGLDGDADGGLGAAWARDTGPYGGALSRLTRYETALERNAARLLAELRHLQAERRLAQRHEAELARERERGPWAERAAQMWPGAPEPSSPGAFSKEEGESAGVAALAEPIASGLSARTGRGGTARAVRGGFSGAAPAQRTSPSPQGGEGGWGDGEQGGAGGRGDGEQGGAGGRGDGQILRNEANLGTLPATAGRATGWPALPELR